jgi:hypothetical protein
MGAGLSIAGTVYSLDDIDEIPMGDLFALKLFTKSQGYGVGVDTINAMLTKVGELAKDDEFDPSSLVSDLDFLANAIGLVYIVRRCAGEKITVQEAWNTPPKAFSFVDTDDEAGEVDEAPKDEAPKPDETVS